jgi:hypothetical protein
MSHGKVDIWRSVKFGKFGSQMLILVGKLEGKREGSVGDAVAVFSKAVK